MSMKKFSKKSISTVLLMVIACFFSFSFVSAENAPITDQQIQLIKNNCVSAKNTLTQLHSSDALLRVNMGQSYESMSTKLMTRLNNRLVINNLASVDLINAADNFDAILDTFRLDYIAYEEQLSIAINIDCQKQPVSFYDAVSSARSKRELVHSDISRLNQALTQYKSEFVKFEANYKTSISEIKQ